MTMRREMLRLFRRTEKALQEAKAQFSEFYQDSDVDPDTVLDAIQTAESAMGQLTSAIEHQWLGQAEGSRAMSEAYDKDDEDEHGEDE